MKAIVKQFISPLMQEGTIIVRKGKYGVIEGHEKRQYVINEYKGKIYKTPNFEPWELIKNMPQYYKVVK